MAIVRLVLNADDAAIAKSMTVTGVKMEVAAGASLDEAVVLTGLMKMSRMGTVTKWNTPYSYVQAEIDPDECITAGEAGFNEVFLIVNAATIPAGRKIFFTVDGKDVSGGDLQFRREVSKDDVDMTFQAGKINTIALKLRDKDLVQETGEFYEKVTCLDDLVEGDYLIVYEGNETHDAVAFNGGLTALDAASNGLAVTISDNKIASTTTLDAAVFTISPDEGTILSKSGLYIGVASNSNGLKTSEDASVYKNIFAFDENGNANILADFEGSTMKLRYNYASDQMRFRYFKTDQQPIALYASPYNIVDTTPRITFEGAEPMDDSNSKMVTKTVPAGATSVEFTFTKNKYVTELPEVRKWSYMGAWFVQDGGWTVTDGKVTFTLTPNTTEYSRDNQFIVLGQGFTDEARMYLMIKQDAYVPGATSEDNPYSVAEAVEAAQELDSESTIEDVYVKGIISRIATAYSSQHNNVSFYISDDGTTGGDELQIFRIPATSEADYTVGDAVEIKGVLKNYQGTSPELTATFEVVYAYKAPSFSPAPGIYTSAQNVTITAADGTPIYYTLDGSNPTTSSSVYSSPISISESKTIKAFTIVNGVSTGVVTAAYTIDAQGNDGSLEHPFTASEARELALSGNTGSYYITGIVTKVQNQYSASYGSANFWIDENGTAQDVFEGYKIKYFGNVNWVNSNAQIAVNDEVIIYGALTVYNNTTPETNGGYLVTLNGKTKGLTLAAPTVTTNAAQKQITVSWTAATGTESAVSYVVTCGSQTYNASAAGSNTFNMPDYGTYDVTVAASASDAVPATISASATLTDPSAGTSILQYTLDGTIMGSGNAYASPHEVTQDNISWQFTGNLEMSPWRIGGKGLTKVDRPIYSTTAISSNITSIELESGSTGSSLTVNSVTVSVHSSASDAESGSNAIATFSFSTGIVNNTITITKTDGSDWSGKYYRIVYNVTRTSTSGNGYVQFKSLKFYGL